MLFLPIFILGFGLLRRALSDNRSKELALDIWIIAGSLVFYGLFGLRNIFVLLVSILWNAAIVRALTGKRAQEKEPAYKKEMAKQEDISEKTIRRHREKAAAKIRDAYHRRRGSNE